MFSTNSIAAGCCVQAKGGSTVSGDDVLPDLSTEWEDLSEIKSHSMEPPEFILGIVRDNEISALATLDKGVLIELGSNLRLNVRKIRL